MIASISIKNFRGFRQTRLNLRELTILVGKNNAGKSTLIEALRIASLVTNRIQRAKFVNPPEWLDRDLDRGIMPSVQNLSMSNKNVFHLYGEPPAVIEIVFMNNIRICIYIGPNLQIFAQIYNAHNDCIKNLKMLKSEYVPIINILPQISPLLESEDMITDATVRANLFTRLSLQEQFARNWSRYVGNSPLFQSKIATSYWHMQGEPFWKLILQDGREATKDNFQGIPYSIANLKKQVRYAAIDQELFKLMQTVDGRVQMRTLLISTYLTNKPIQKENLLTLLMTFGSSLLPIAS